MVICDCCRREVDYVRGSPWHGAARICRACFFVWYDCGLVKPADLRAFVLAAEAAGTWPFERARINIPQGNR